MWPHQLAGVMSGPQLDVKWDLEGVSASHSLLEKTVIAVPMDTITSLSASVSLFFFLSRTAQSFPFLPFLILI